MQVSTDDLSIDAIPSLLINTGTQNNYVQTSDGQSMSHDFELENSLAGPRGGESRRNFLVGSGMDVPVNPVKGRREKTALKMMRVRTVFDQHQVSIPKDSRSRRCAV